MKRRNVGVWGTALAFLVLAGGAAFAQSAPDQDNPGVWLPHAASDYSDDVDYLYRVIFYITTAMFILTEGLLIAFCIIYRRRPGHRPTYTHGSNKAEITWTVVPALILLGLALWQIPTWNRIKKVFPNPQDSNVTTVDVIGEQFKWQIRYPGTKAKYGGEYDYANTSIVHMPFGNTALFNLRSKDVIHSVFIPHMRVKQDTVPGLRQRLWFKPNRFFLVDLKAPHTQDGQMPVLENFKWVKKPRMVQPRVWVTEEKDFGPGGRFFDKRIAVSALSNYFEKDGLYGLLAPGMRVRTLYQGKIQEGQEWASCDYAVGIFEIACAELCGLGHYTMRGFLVVEPRPSYDWWIKSESEDAGDPSSITNAWKAWRD